VGTPPVPPQVGDGTLVQTGASPCPLASTGTFSNFVSSSTACTVQLNAAMTFQGTGAPGVTCAQAGLTVNGVAMTCPGGAGGNANATWTSAPITIQPSAGAVTLTLAYSKTSGAIPSGASGGTGGNCTAAKPCTGSFGVVQRVFSGAYDLATAGTSDSGPTVSATVADASTNGEIQSIAKGTSKNVVISVDVLGYQNSTSIPSPPVVMHTAGNQGTYAINCTGNNGNPSFTGALQNGCPPPGYATTAAANPPICTNQPPGPPVCVSQNPGNGKKVEPGINARINGSTNANTCSTNTNHWASPNTIAQVLSASPSDPRIVQVLIVDSNAWIGVSGGSFQTPVRQFAAFYITGWQGDPCIGQPNGTSANGLAYTTDDNPGSQQNVLLGHFVKYVVPGAGTGGTGCTQNTFGNCVAVLTK
jgi:hypothetical protein